jgi:hypothetical protein
MMNNRNLDKHLGHFHYKSDARPVYVICVTCIGFSWRPGVRHRVWAHAAIMAATEGPIPTAEEKNRIMAAKKELIQALVKRRALDKQLVR